jgi:predicted RNase H-related nuclease YkuK (DUF458 family)
MNTFRKFDGTQIPDVAAYVTDYIQAHPGAKVTVGTDSKQRKNVTVYVSVICLQEAARGGVHIIFAKDVVPRVNDIFSRLWGEVERSKTVADGLMERFWHAEVVDFQFKIHLDFNADPRHKSNPVYQSGMGYILGLGYIAEAKPAGWAASYAADMLCNSLGVSRRRKRKVDGLEPNLA